MKITYVLWTLLFVVGWTTAGFVPALVLLVIAGAASVSTGLSKQRKLGSSSYRRMLS